jgi:hypothetical protein
MRLTLAPAVTRSPSWLKLDPVRVISSASTVAVGKDPMSPVMVVPPVFVIPVPARTAKLVAMPRPTGSAARAGAAVTSRPASRRAPAVLTSRTVRGRDAGDRWVGGNAGMTLL